MPSSDRYCRPRTRTSKRIETTLEIALSAAQTASMPVVGLEAWFTQIPPVTRTWLALSVLASVAVVRSFYRGPTSLGGGPFACFATDL